MTKQCKKCEQVKDITEFYANNMAADRHATLCKVCSREAAIRIHRQRRSDLSLSRIGHSRRIFEQKLKELK